MAMNSTKDLLKKTDELISKIRRLSEKQDKLITELKSKDEKIEVLRNQQTSNQERIDSLEQEVASLKLGAFVNLSDENKKEVRRKLNEYLRELDGVIAKLSGED